MLQVTILNLHLTDTTGNTLMHYVVEVVLVLKELRTGYFFCRLAFLYSVSFVCCVRFLPAAQGLFVL